MKRSKITIYRDHVGEWRWQRQANNSTIIGASTQGYRRKADAVANLTTELGGILYITYSGRTPAGRLFQQGELVRAIIGVTTTTLNGQRSREVTAFRPEVIPVQVIP